MPTHLVVAAWTIPKKIHILDFKLMIFNLCDRGKAIYCAANLFFWSAAKPLIIRKMLQQSTEVLDVKVE